MVNTRKRHYEALGQDAYYDEVMPWLETLYDRYLQDEDGHYLIAVNEAVCNAAKYANDGPALAPIDIEVVITPGQDISVSVRSDTQPFNVEMFRDNMRKLAADDSPWKDREWCDYTGSTERSRGYWLMLMSVSYLYIRSDGKEVTLYADIPFQKEHVTRKISDIVPRLLLMKNGVIY